MTLTFTPVHPQVETSRGILVDEAIAPLLECLWLAGLETLASCQGQDKGFICFQHEWAADRFVEATPHAGLHQHGSYVEVRTDGLAYLARLWGAT